VIGMHDVTLVLMFMMRIICLPIRLCCWLLTRWGIWTGLRLVSLGALLAIVTRELHAAGWNPVTFIVDGDPGKLPPLVITIFVTGGLFLLTPARKRPVTHGSAAWATGKDLQDLLIGRKQALPPGAFALAPYGRWQQLIVPPDKATHHTLIVGGSGTGKTRSLFLPNAAGAQGSFVATDPKGELWEHTSGFHGTAWRFAPREPAASLGFNWIPWCRDPRLAELLASAAMQLETDTHEQQFWKLADMQLCAAVFAHAAYQSVPTPATAYALLELGSSGLVAHLRNSPAPKAKVCAGMLAELKPETRAGIVLSVVNKLSFLQDPAVQRFTSAVTAAADFTALVRQPIAAYWVLHEQDVALLQPLSSLFFTLLLDQLSRVRGALVPVTLLLDEFANLGRLPGFATTISVARGRGLALVLGVQALSQLDGRYGRNDADTIRTNCATKVILHGLDYQSAEHVSRMLGETTVRQEYQSRRPEGLLVTSYSYSEHQTSRRLMTADEVRRLSREELLIVSENRRPIKVGRWFWAQPPNEARARGLGQANVAVPSPVLPPAPTPRSAASLRDRLQHLDERDTP